MAEGRRNGEKVEPSHFPLASPICSDPLLRILSLPLLNHALWTFAAAPSLTSSDVRRNMKMGKVVPYPKLSVALSVAVVRLARRTERETEMQTDRQTDRQTGHSP